MNISTKTQFWRMARAPVFFTAVIFATVFSRRIRYEVERSIWGVDSMPQTHREYLSHYRARRNEIERRVEILGPRCLSWRERLWLRWQMISLEVA